MSLKVSKSRRVLLGEVAAQTTAFGRASAAGSCAACAFFTEVKR